MPTRSAARVTALTLAAAAVLAVAAWPTRAAADDERWERGRHARGKWAKRPQVVYVAPIPVVVVPAPPVVVVRPQPRAYVWIEGHYESREETRYVPGPPVPVWVPPQLGLAWRDGRVVSVALSTGHYEYRPGPLAPVKEVVQVWVPGRWVPAGEAVAYRREED